MQQRSASFEEAQSSDSESLNPYVKVARDESSGSALSSDVDGDDDGGEHSTDRLAVTSSEDSSRSPSNGRDLFGSQNKSGDGAVTGTSTGGPSPPSEHEEGGTAVAKRPAAVGLINEGCTCYLNSLLQLLFHTSYFRTAVYQIPVEGDNGPSVYKALQETFFQMQERTTPARTTTLTNAFGWGKRELYVQHDIQEMATLLRDNLEERMKGTVTEGAINQLFEGRGEQFVETLDKSYVSRRADTYYDIHIPLGQHHTLIDSLTSLTARDQLVGDNKYRVEREGKPAVYMDAEKGYSYTRFPAVTWFHLKRFAMDLTSPTLEMRKVNAPLEFPVELDLRGLEKPEAATDNGMSDGAEASKPKKGSAVVPFPADSPAVYDLQGVIVHRGTVRSGHYYCYIHEWDSAEQRYTRWLEYDDDNVREVPEDVAVRANYGRSAPVDSFRHESAVMGGANAYILSYVRRADAPTILAPSPTDIVSDRVKEALRRAIQEEEQQLREAEEARMSASLCCLTDATLSAYCNAICSTELYTRDAHQWRRSAECVVTVRKSNTLLAVYEALAAQPALARRGVTAESFRIWRCADIGALRPTIPLPTYAEVVARMHGDGEGEGEGGTARPAECLCDYLTQEENNTALTMCIYIDQAKPQLPGLREVTKETGLIESVQPDAATRCYIVKLSRPVEAKALHVILDNADYAATVEYVTTTTKETLPVAMVSVTAGDNAVALPLSESRKIISITVKACIPGVRHVPVRDVHLELPFGHPLLQPPSAATTSALPVLPSINCDRALVFFKYYDYATNTVQYVGSRLIDRAAKVYCCAAVYRDALGLSDGTSSTAVSESGSSTSNPANTTSSAAATTTATPKQPPAPSMFRYFVERGDHTPMEVNEQFDLGEFKSGTVLVAQLRNIPAPYRNLCVRNFYRDTRNSLDAHVIEVRRTHQMNDEAYRQTTLELQKAAVNAATTAAAKLNAATASPAIPAAVAAAENNNGASAETTTTAATEGGVANVAVGKNPSAMNSTASLPTVNTITGGITDSIHTTSDLAMTTTDIANGPSNNSGGGGVAAPSSSGAKPTSAVAALAAAAESDPTRIAALLNPYEAVQLPTLHEAVVETLPVGNCCRLLSSWSYEAVCAAIGRAIGYDPSHIQLYQNSSTGEPTPDTAPTPFSTITTVSDLLYLEGYNPTSVLFYERLPIPREQQQSTAVVTITLRDRAGHALHRESYTVKVATVTRQGLVRLVRQSVPMWQREADPWGTIRDTLQSTHYVLSFVDTLRHLIVCFHEVSMSSPGREESKLDPAWVRSFDVEIQAAAPLQATEQRVACCHMNYDSAERSSAAQQQRCAFGQPFLITIDTTTTVRDAQAILLQTTHLPQEMLHNAHGFGVMMVAGQIYHFDNWDEHVHLYWAHTKNTSSYVPSLMMNHAKPREKPGSRYVAQCNPQLKISNK
jgi:ubiquitin C-terminal hydrolase